MSQHEHRPTYKLQYDLHKMPEIAITPYYTTQSQKRAWQLLITVTIIGMLICLFLLNYGFDWIHILFLCAGIVAGYSIAWLLAHIIAQGQSQFVRDNSSNASCELMLDDTSMVARSSQFEHKFHWSQISDISLMDNHLIISTQDLTCAVLTSNTTNPEERASIFGDIINFWKNKRNETE